MTANTPHIVFDELAARTPVPLLSIVEVCAEEARRRGLRRRHVEAIVERLRRAA